MPAQPAATRLHTFTADSTTSAWIGPSFVCTPITLCPSRIRPVTSVSVRIVAPPRRAARAKLVVTR